MNLISRSRPGPRTVAAALSALAAGMSMAGLPANASSAIHPAATGNACSNPVLASNLNGWGPLDGAADSRDSVGDLPGASWAFDTAGHSFYMPQLSVSTGQTWTFTAQDRVLYAAGTAEIAIDWYNSAGQYMYEQTGAAVSLPASGLGGGTWKPVSATFTVPSGAITAHVLQFGDFGSATGTAFKATECDYEQTTPSPMASVRYNWGTDNPSESDEYNGTSVDETKWGRFGEGGTGNCSPGLDGGERCASQTTEGNGYLTVTATANGYTGGLWSNATPFRYGRVEVRERAVPTGNTGKPYHAVPLLWPFDDNYTHAEIDFAERNVGDPAVDLFVHHDGTQSSYSATIDSTQFHNYAIDWEPNSVTWYIDGVQIYSLDVSITDYDKTNGGAQMDMLYPTGTLMCPAHEDVDWIHMFPTPATQYHTGT